MEVLLKWQSQGRSSGERGAFGVGDSEGVGGLRKDSWDSGRRMVRS